MINNYNKAYKYYFKMSNYLKCICYVLDINRVRIRHIEKNVGYF